MVLYSAHFLQQLSLTICQGCRKRYLIGDDEVAPTLPFAAQTDFGAGLRAGLDLELELGARRGAYDDLATQQGGLQRQFKL